MNTFMAYFIRFMKIVARKIVYGLSILCVFQLFVACTENKKDNTAPASALEKKTKKVSAAGITTEEKVDKFLTDYVNDLKDALAEKDDKLTIAKIQQMKEKFGSRLEELKPELEMWEESLTDEEKAALENRAESKPYVKDLIATSFTAMSRMSKSPELRQAFDDLSHDMSFMSKDISNEEITGEELPEEAFEEEESELE